MTPKAPEDKVVTAVGPHTTHILVAVVGCCFLCLWHELQALNMIYPVDCSLSEKMKYSMGNPFPFFFFLMCGYRNIFFQNVCFFTYECLCYCLFSFLSTMLQSFIMVDCFDFKGISPHLVSKRVFVFIYLYFLSYFLCMKFFHSLCPSSTDEKILYCNIVGIYIRILLH